MTLSRALRLAEKIIIDGVEYSQNDRNNVISSNNTVVSLKDFLSNNKDTKVFIAVHKNNTQQIIDLTDPDYWYQIDLETLKQQSLDALHQKEMLILEHKKFLSDTDYKVLPDYDKTENAIIIKEQRQEAREAIRRLEQELLAANL